MVKSLIFKELSDLAKMNPILLYFLRLLVSREVFNQMEADREPIGPEIQRGRELQKILERLSLSDELERDTFYFNLDQEDRDSLRAYFEWIEGEAESSFNWILSVRLTYLMSMDGYITPNPFLFLVLDFKFDDKYDSRDDLYDFEINIHYLLVFLTEMSTKISSTATFDLDFFKLLENYKLIFIFLHECIAEHKFVITQESHLSLARFLSQHGIDLDNFFSNGGILIPGSPEFDEIFLHAMMKSSELSTLTVSYGDPLHVEWCIQLFRCWTIIHKRLSSEEHPVQDLLPFLKEVLPHLQQTKKFVRERELSDAMYGVLANLYRKLNKGSDAEIPEDLGELLGFMQEWLNTTMFPESSEPPSMRELLVEKLAGITCTEWGTFCFSKRFEKMSPDEKALIERALALFQAPEDIPNFRGPNICDLSKEDQDAVSFYWKTKKESLREASGMYASCVSPPLVPEMLLKFLMFLGFPSGLLNPADLPGTITAVMIHFHEQVSSPETQEKMKEVCNAQFICGVLEYLQIPESCVIGKTYSTVTAFFEEEF
jgi:hypothetical protein